MVYLTRIEHFNAAHKLYNPNWSKEKNDEVFGKCANENWHGHNFELFVTIKGLISFAVAATTSIFFPILANIVHHW